MAGTLRHSQPKGRATDYARPTATAPAADSTLSKRLWMRSGLRRVVGVGLCSAMSLLLSSRLLQQPPLLDGVAASGTYRMQATGNPPEIKTDETAAEATATTRGVRM